MSKRIPAGMFPKERQGRDGYYQRPEWAVCYCCLHVFRGFDQKEVSRDMKAHVDNGTCAANQQALKDAYPDSYCLKHNVRFDKEGEMCGMCSSEQSLADRRKAGYREVARQIDLNNVAPLEAPKPYVPKPIDPCACCGRLPPTTDRSDVVLRLRLSADHTGWLMIAKRPPEGGAFEEQYICPACTPAALNAIRELRDVTPKVETKPSEPYPSDDDLLAPDA